VKEIKRDWREFAFRTRAVRAGHERTLEGEHAEPIFTTSSFVFKDAAQAAARFADEEPGNVYSRFTNPTVRMFEQRLAALEEGERCVATSSGMSSILATCMALLKAGDHIVAASSLFGATISLFNNVLTRFSLTTTFVSLTDLDAWRQAITPATRMLFLGRRPTHSRRLLI
jgi:O-succinylhomoserine sulfhydrylase